MTIEKAINLAIEGGWSFKYEPYDYVENINDCPKLAFLDPLFWQSLGKAMGWQHEIKSLVTGEVIEPSVTIGKYIWKKQWHRFIDHLAEGKDANSFFEKL